MSNKGYLFAILGVIVLIVLYASTFIVTEGQRAIILRLGEISKIPGTDKARVYGPGLHFKTPFITTVHNFDVRLRDLTVNSSRIATKMQKYVVVSYYARWRIQNLPLFYTRTGGYDIRAQQLLEQKINGSLRAAFGKYTIQQVISDQRSNIMKLLQDQAEESAKNLGVNVVDVRLVGVDFPPSAQETVFKRMRFRREQVATKLRSQGRAQQQEIVANADRKVVVALAKAKADAQKVRASGDQEAGKIYSDAYRKDPKFYALYRSLEAYRKVFNNKSTLMVLRPKGQFFKYFNAENGETSKKGTQ